MNFNVKNSTGSWWYTILCDTFIDIWISSFYRIDCDFASGMIQFFKGIKKINILTMII
jgi:hypothetical protein